jgi:glycosyltransferase involved in cell wall biosynthesis
MNEKKKILLSIRSLNSGGAERQFINLVKNINKGAFEVIVCSMYGGELEGEILECKDVRYYNLAKKNRYDLFRFIKTYKEVVCSESPDVIYSFMTEMNIFSLLLRSISTCNCRLIWGIRVSDINMKKYSYFDQFIFYIENFLSSFVDEVIVNSHAAKAFLLEKGFKFKEYYVVHNGIDVNKFHVNSEYRREFRRAHSLKDGDIAIVIAARMDVMKGYLLLSRAMDRIFQSYDNVYLFSIGRIDIDIKRECDIFLENHHGKFLFMGLQKNVEEIFNGCDICVSASLFGEGFSNSIAEAISCGLPCIATNVGDSSFIVEGDGYIIPPNSVNSLVYSIEKMINNKDLLCLKHNRHDRILNDFSISDMVKATEKILL